MENDANAYEAKMHGLARKVVGLSTASLFADMPFLDTALFRLRFRPAEPGEARTWVTDGRDVLYDARHVLRRYRDKASAVAHDVLHVVLHCVFRHMFVEPGIEQRYWNLACDIAVESLIDSLGLPAFDDGSLDTRGAYLGALLDVPELPSAERFYRELREAELSEEDLLVLQDAFFVDDHPWYWAQAKDGEGEGKRKRERDESDASDSALQEMQALDQGNLEQLQRDWEDASRSVQTGLETLFARQGSGAQTAGLLQALKAVNRRRYDYREFLRSLCSWGEQMHLNQDEFDYVYYTFGMDMYGDMPLIEPLEYKETKRLRDIAICIDTSASVAGELLQRLFECSYDLICSERTSHRRFRIRLLQCDEQVQDDIVLHSREELDQALDHMEFKGLGGTDFRPAFEHVNRLMADGELVGFKGLVYFTDGRGRFPEQAPGYKAAFVIVGEDNAEVEVPTWAIKLVLSEDEVRKL